MVESFIRISRALHPGCAQRLLYRLPACIAAALWLGLAPSAAWAQRALPPGFVYLRDIDPTIAQDIRYATTNNFIGRPMTGYEAGECVLRRDVALALAQVQADLAPTGRGLKVYDCYRPTQAVRMMMNWAHDGVPPGRTRRFFPRVPSKAALFALGYIASVSRHSTGTAIDLTLIDRPGASPAPFDPSAAYGPCIAPVAQRAPDNSIDMGTGYDCLDTNSYTHSSAVSADDRARRNALVAAMARRGFANYFREWWHFQFARPGSIAYYDFPIRPR
jgi:D-alanyl-D-alanine dipeptidase